MSVKPRAGLGRIPMRLSWHRRLKPRALPFKARWVDFKAKNIAAKVIEFSIASDGVCLKVDKFNEEKTEET
jgi:hypothetical protein